MVARIQNTLRMIGKQIHDWRIPQVPRLNSEERTQLTWAKAIKSYESVPDGYQEFFNPYLSSGKTFPYTVLTPAFETFGYRITGKLICAFDHEIYILERNGKSLVTQCYPLEGISYVETSSMLLDSRIKISGVTSEGISSSAIVRFSTATDYLFTPILKKIRYPDLSKGAVQGRDDQAFDRWIRLNFKFMNLARNSLLRGEKVVHSILQPEIKADRFTMLGRTLYRTISPTHVCILTDRELITIREEALQGRKDKYGAIWDYFPLNKIAALSVERKDDDLLVLTVKLLTDDRFEYLYQVSLKDELGQLLHKYGDLKSR